MELTANLGLCGRFTVLVVLTYGMYVPITLSLQYWNERQILVKREREREKKPRKAKLCAIELILHDAYCLPKHRSNGFLVRFYLLSHSIKRIQFVTAVNWSKMQHTWIYWRAIKSLWELIEKIFIIFWQSKEIKLDLSSIGYITNSVMRILPCAQLIMFKENGF